MVVVFLLSTNPRQGSRKAIPMCALDNRQDGNRVGRRDGGSRPRSFDRSDAIPDKSCAPVPKVKGPRRLRLVRLIPPPRQDRSVCATARHVQKEGKRQARPFGPWLSRKIQETIIHYIKRAPRRPVGYNDDRTFTGVEGHVECTSFYRFKLFNRASNSDTWGSSPPPIATWPGCSEILPPVGVANPAVCGSSVEGAQSGGV
jgi:hypothetical protein